MYERRWWWAAAAAALLGLLATAPARADSLFDALASTYVTNPNLNAARAAVRGADEDVPQALSGYRPTIGLTADLGVETDRSTTNGKWSTPLYPRGLAFTVEQPIFRGFQTKNSVGAAESSVRATREQLRGIEQDTLLDAVQAFMDVVQGQVVVNLRAQNVAFLREQVRAATDRLNVGEGTKTDVAQANARLSSGISGYAAAVARLNAAIATYEQVVGHKPRNLGVANSIDRLLPKSEGAAVDIALGRHPSIIGASYNVDVSSFNVNILEGQMLPTASIQGQYTHRDDLNFSNFWRDSATITGQLSVPIYEAGRTSSEIRQAKETLGQRRIQLDLARTQIRQAVISAWGALDAARAQITAAEAGVSANQLALAGVIEERRVGQRTTLDVLNAQQDLLNSREALVQAQHDAVIAAYTLLSDIGKLDAASLGLRVTIYDPTHHYKQVRDKWFGLRTPDGR